MIKNPEMFKEAREMDDEQIRRALIHARNDGCDSEWIAALETEQKRRKK